MNSPSIALPTSLIKTLMKRSIKLIKQIEALNKAFAMIGRLSVLLMLALGLWNVLGRYIGAAIGYNLSSNALIEGQWYLFDLIFLLGMGWTLQRKGHVRVDIIQNRWQPKKKAIIELIGTLTLLLPFALGVLAISIKPAINSWVIAEASPDPDGLPRYLIKALIPLGFLLLALQGSAEAIKQWLLLKELSIKKMPPEYTNNK